MTSNIIKPTIAKLKELYPIAKPYVSFGVISAFILFSIAILDKCESIETNASFKDSILHEIHIARNTLDYTLAQRKLNVRNRPTFKLELSGKVSESFADNQQLKTELIDLYRSLSSAKASAIELMDLISKNNSNKTTIKNRENDIIRAIRFADEVGPRIASYISGSWDIPPSIMSPNERIKYYETETPLIYSAASDEQVKAEWNWQEIK